MKDKHTVYLILGVVAIALIAYVAVFNQRKEVAPRSVESYSETVEYKEPSGAFSLRYNPLFSITNGAKEFTLDWDSRNTSQGNLLTTVLIPKSVMPNTNFSEAKLTVGRSSDEKAIKECTKKEGNETGEKVTLNGFPFMKFDATGAGAGNLYETTSYRGLLDGDCYVLEYVIHSTNIYNYPPEMGIKEFDKSFVQNELENIVHGFKFLVNSD